MAAGNLSPTGGAACGTVPVTSVADASGCCAICRTGLAGILAPVLGFGCGAGVVAGGVAGTGSEGGGAASGLAGAGGSGVGRVETGGAEFSGCACGGGGAAGVLDSNIREAICKQPITISAAAPAMINGRVRWRPPLVA